MKILDTNGDIDKISASDARVHCEVRDDGTGMLMIVDTDGARAFDLLPAREGDNALIVLSEIAPPVTGL